MSYGNGFVQGTTGGTYAAGWRLKESGVPNNGTIVKAGNVASDGVANDLSLATLADDDGTSFGSKVIASDGTGASTTDRVGISGAVVGGVVGGTTVLGYGANETEWVVQGGNVTTTLGGVANSVLVGGARDYNGSINDESLEVARTKIGDVTMGSGESTVFNVLARPSTELVPGRTKGGGAGSAFTFVNPADGTAAVAAEIAPSRAVPGELVYHFGGEAEPTLDDYKAKDVHES